MRVTSPWYYYCNIAFLLTAYCVLGTKDDKYSYNNDDHRLLLRGKQQQQQQQQKQHSKKSGGGPAIAVLTTNAPNDIEELCVALNSLNFLHGDYFQVHHAPILVFNEGDLEDRQMKFIDDCTDRIVAFPYVDLNSHFPKGFDPDKEWMEYSKPKYFFEAKPGRDKWSYAQMIRFWTTGIWKHPAIQQFDTVMRIDTDSCFMDTREYHNPTFDALPNLEGRFVYQSIRPSNSIPNYVQGLFTFAVGYMRRHDITPSNPNLWKIVEDTWRNEKTLPLFKTNFENNRRAFFQSPQVMQWHEALTEKEPFGVWRGRWGDAHTRFLTMAMFGTPANVLISEDNGYHHGKKHCNQLADKKKS